MGGFPVKCGLMMPLFARQLFLADLDAMCRFYVSPGIRGTPAEFKKHVPGALDAEGWFRHHNRYGNGEPIVGNKSRPLTSLMNSYAVAAAVAIAASAIWFTGWRIGREYETLAPLL